jgi:integrase
MPFRREGSSLWYIRVKGVRKSSGTEIYEDAKALEDRLNHQAWLNNRMGLPAPKSWKEAVVRWCKEKKHKASFQDDLDKIRWLDTFLGSVEDIGRITRDQVDGIMLSRAGVSGDVPGPSNATANRYVALVSGILNAAEREWGWGNRAPKLRRYPEQAGGGRCLTVDEWKALETASPEHLRFTEKFSIASGLREGKVFGLQWSMVDFQNRSLSFTGTDNKLGNTIPLNETAMSVLHAIRSKPVVHATHVFTWDGRPMKEHGQAAFRKAVERAGIGHVRWHDLRHTFNSWLAQNGVPSEIRKRLMGHKTSEVHDRYTHLYVEHLRPYSAIIDSLLSQSTGQTATQKAVTA